MSSTGGSRVQEALQGFPLGTLTILAVNIGIFVLQSLFDFSVAEYAIAAAPVILKGQIYRIYTAALLHGGLMHIGMNMMSTASLGSGLVRALCVAAHKIHGLMIGYNIALVFALARKQSLGQLPL